MSEFRYQECWSYIEEQDFSRLCTVEQLVNEFILHKEVYIETKEDLEKELRSCKTYYNDGNIEPTYSEEEIKNMCEQFCIRKACKKEEWDSLNIGGETIGINELFPSDVFGKKK